MKRPNCKFTVMLAVLMAACASALTSCSDDELGESIFSTDPVQRSEFDQWLVKNYTNPYNIRVIYRYVDYETDQGYNLVPADIENTKTMSIIMRHIWLDAYTEAMGGDSTFMKTYCPRIFQYVGSGMYNSNGSMVLGVAEGGLKITLFRVNEIDAAHVHIDSIRPFPDTNRVPLDLNYWYFWTMHHEFCHILHQTKNYSTDFKLVSAGKYRTTDWVNVADADAPAMGFVSGYACSEEREDFAEMYSFYVTHTETAWQELLEAGVVGDDTSGRDAILTKMAIMKEYFRTSWGLDMDRLRSIVLRRCGELSTMDLTKLN